MGEAIGFVVFGLIGIALAGAVLYIMGMLLSGPVILVDETVKGIHHFEEEHGHKGTPRHSGKVALHH